MSQPDSIGIRELRQHASRYVAMAKAGRRVPVTERGKLVAYLVPAEETRSAFEQMGAAGQVRMATGDLREYLRDNPPLPAEPGERPLSEVLPRTDVLLGQINQVTVSTRRDRIGEPATRSTPSLLDVIHLATVLLICDDLDVVLTYDTRLAEAAAAHGLATASPA